MQRGKDECPEQLNFLASRVTPAASAHTAPLTHLQTSLKIKLTLCVGFKSISHTQSKLAMQYFIHKVSVHIIVVSYSQIHTDNCALQNTVEMH